MSQDFDFSDQSTTPPRRKPPRRKQFNLRLAVLGALLMSSCLLTPLINSTLGKTAAAVLCVTSPIMFMVGVALLLLVETKRCDVFFAKFTGHSNPQVFIGASSDDLLATLGLPDASKFDGTKEELRFKFSDVDLVVVLVNGIVRRITETRGDESWSS